MPEPQIVVEQALESTASAESADPGESSPSLPVPVHQEWTGGSTLSALPAVITLSPDPDSSDDLREDAKVKAGRFNHRNVWLPFARVVAKIHRGRAYQRWGYDSLSAYAEGELNITKATASGLLSAFYYLETQHPEYLMAESSLTVKLSPCPPYSSIAALARSRKFLSPSLRVKLDEELFSDRLTRLALLEAIASARAERASGQGSQPKRRSSVYRLRDEGQDPLLQELEALFAAVDLKVLRETLTAVIEGWETDSQAERRALLAQVNELFQHLTKIEELPHAAHV